MLLLYSVQLPQNNGLKYIQVKIDANILMPITMQNAGHFTKYTTISETCGNTAL